MKKILLMLTSLFILFFASISLANAETSYTYYWGNGCSYCAKVDSYLNGVEDISLINIDKKEVYYNRDNAKQMNEDSARLGIDTPGVPFLIINTDGKETYLNGDKTIIEHFTPILGESIKAESNKGIFILVLLGLLFLPFVALKMYSKK